MHERTPTMSIKYKILKGIDLAGLNFLRPVILLCYREEPEEQVRQIALHILVPILAFALFLFLWSILAPLHKTRSGEVPTPAVVWDSAKQVWQFHTRQSEQLEAYEATGAQREQMLQRARARLAEIEPLEAEARRQLQQADATLAAFIETEVQPLQAEYESLRYQFRDQQNARKAELEKLASTLTAEDRSARDTFLKQYHAHEQETESEKQTLRDLKSRQDTVRAKVFPERIEALRAQSAIAEEKQFLLKLVDTLENNKAQKLAEEQAQYETQLEAFYTADGEELPLLAKSLLFTETRIQNTATSSYAKPMTLPDQVLRSIACVFAGFVIASVIAIPIGIICGLSRVVMSALTPFIALFKPVSPIVWLPILFIIVGGFIPDPDQHWLISAMAQAPLIGWMKINPAFIASALTVAMCSLWPTLVNTAFGVASIDRDHLNVARVLRLGFWSRLFKIVIPSALPLTFAGLRISLGVGWMVLIAAELLSSSEGVGKFVWDMFNNGSSQTFAQMFVVVFVVGIIGFMLDRIMIIFQRLVSFDENAPSL